MKTLDVNEMSAIRGGECWGCGEQIVFGVMLGGMIGGGIGSIVGAVGAVMGAGCLDLFNQGYCD